MGTVAGPDGKPAPGGMGKVILAGALGLKTVGTISELSTLIKSHLLDNSDIQLDPRFSGLFLQNKRRRVDNSSGIAVDTGL